MCYRAVHWKARPKPHWNSLNTTCGKPRMVDRFTVAAYIYYVEETIPVKLLNSYDMFKNRNWILIYPPPFFLTNLLIVGLICGAAEGTHRTLILLVYVQLYVMGCFEEFILFLYRCGQKLYRNLSTNIHLHFKTNLLVPVPELLLPNTAVNSPSWRLIAGKFKLPCMRVCR